MQLTTVIPELSVYYCPTLYCYVRYRLINLYNFYKKAGFHFSMDLQKIKNGIHL